METPVVVKCPGCGLTIKVRSTALDGRKGKCRECGEVFVPADCIAGDDSRKSRERQPPAGQSKSSERSNTKPQLPQKPAGKSRSAKSKRKSRPQSSQLVPILSVVAAVVVVSAVAIVAWQFWPPSGNPVNPEELVALADNSSNGGALEGNATEENAVVATESSQASSPVSDTVSPVAEVETIPISESSSSSQAMVAATEEKPRPTQAFPDVAEEMRKRQKELTDWKMRKTSDSVFSYEVPGGNSSQLTIQRNTPWGRLSVEELEITASNGIKYSLQQFEFPETERKQLKRVKEFLENLASSSMSERMTSKFIESRMLDDQVCPCLEYEYTVNEGGDRFVKNRVYLWDLTAYWFHSENPLQADDAKTASAQADVERFWASIVNTPDTLPYSVKQQLAARKRDPLEQVAADRMAELYQGIQLQSQALLSANMKLALEAMQKKEKLKELVSTNPQLSWRVHILPYIGEEELYKQFHLDEPWDSEHNKSLVEKMPAVYACEGVDIPKGHTVYQKPDGPQTPRDSERSGGAGLGTGMILLLEVDADKAVVWTALEDFSIEQLDQATDLNGLGKLRSKGFLVNDGQFIAEDFDRASFKQRCIMKKNATTGK